MAPPLPFCAVPWTAETAALLERASLAIARLDARVSASSCASAWRLRAAWAGYAQALRLNGAEIDGIDVFSWGCGVSPPGRPPRRTTIDEFTAFAPWQVRIAANARRHWREDLPFSFVVPEQWSQAPLLIRAFDVVDAFARRHPTVEAWLELPLLLHRLGATSTPLPCLAGGDRAMRTGARDRDAVLKRLLRALAETAETGRKRLLAIEADRRRALGAIARERRPGSLTRLAALTEAQPVLTPQSVARRMGMTLSGAGKLLARAQRMGLLREITGRRSWRGYLTPDLAISFGYAAAPRGRPRSSPPPLAATRAVADIVRDFDREMEALIQSMPALAAMAAEPGDEDDHDQC